MRIAVLTAAVPFAEGPLRQLAAELACALEQCGHAALVVNLPLPGGPLPVEHVLAIRALRLPNVDRAIALGFPACAVRHANKLVWLVSCGAGSQPGSQPAAASQAARLYLRESSAIYTDSPQSAQRVAEECGVEPRVLGPPPDGPAWRHIAEVLTA